MVRVGDKMKDAKYEALKVIFKEFVKSQIQDLEPLDCKVENVRKGWLALGKARGTLISLENGCIDDICDLKTRWTA